MARHRSKNHSSRLSESSSSRSSHSEYSDASGDASDTTASNDNQALVPTTYTTQALAVPTASNSVSLWPTDVDLGTDVTHGRIIRQRDGSYTMSWAANAERTSCALCYRRFHNRAKMEEHQRDNTRPCYVCQTPITWCLDGLDQARSRPCSYWSCLEHRRCCNSHKSAIEHAIREAHTSCFFPACVDVMAIGPRHYVEVHNHMWHKHRLVSA